MSPPPNSESPMIVPTSATRNVAARAKITIAVYLITSSRLRPAGTASRHRRVPRFASPATESPEMALTASGRNSGSSKARAPNATNSPLPAIAMIKSGPPFWLGEDSRIEMAKITGSTASTPSPAILRRRPKMILSSDLRKRVDTRARGRELTTKSSAADIEALAGQRHEYILKAWLEHRESKYWHISIDQVRHDLFDGHVA